MAEHVVDRLWAERMSTNPRTAQKARTEIPFRRDCDVAKMVLVKVADRLERQGRGWMAEQLIRESIFDLIDDATIDQPSPAERQLNALLLSMPMEARPSWVRAEHNHPIDTIAYLTDDDI